MTFTLRYTRYGALGLPEAKEEATAEREDVAAALTGLLDTMTPGDAATIEVRHDLPARHPLATA